MYTYMHIYIYTNIHISIYVQIYMYHMCSGLPNRHVPALPPRQATSQIRRTTRIYLSICMYMYVYISWGEVRPYYTRHAPASPPKQAILKIRQTTRIYVCICQCLHMLIKAKGVLCVKVIRLPSFQKSQRRNS